MLSLEPINEFSEKGKRYYTTDFNKDDLDEIIIGRMYVKCNNYILKVIEMTDNYVYCDIKSIPFEERELLKDKMSFNREFYHDYYSNGREKQNSRILCQKKQYLNEKSKVL